MTRDELIAALEEADQTTEWRVVADWPYEVSRCGLIRKLDGRPIKQTLSPKGYLRTTLFKPGKTKHFRAHRLIAAAFLGEIPLGKQVNHIDGDKTNNNVGNLEIVTCAENVAHAVRTGLMAFGDRNGTRTKPHRVARGERASQVKLTAASVLDIRARRSSGEHLEAIAATYGVDQSLISQIAKRKIWTHV